jgi:chloride channel protein, CIC family
LTRPGIHPKRVRSEPARCVIVRCVQASPAQPTGAEARPDPGELLKSRSYVALLVLGAIVGAPVAAIAYFFLKAVGELQHYFYATLPGDLGFGHEPLWWPAPLLALGGLLVALTIRHLPGTGGHKPAEGLKTGATRPIELPGIILAALATLSFGAVLGPEAPLITMGAGLGVLAVTLVKRDAPPTAALVIGVAGSFAAISTLLGSPLVGAFLLMEAAGVGGPMLGVVLVPGLLAAGVGALIFVGLDNWTGFGTFSLALPDIPQFTTPDGAEFLWAIGIGLAAAVLGTSITRVALLLQPVVERRMVLLTPIVGVVVAGAAMVFAATTDRSSSEVLYSGQDALPPLIQGAAGWTVGALALIVACKSVAYAASLSAFRGGPVFPGMFIGAAGGILLSHLPGLPMIAGVGMGIGAMTVAMLRLPLVSVLLPTLFLQADGLSLMPLVIVAVVVAYVASARLAPAPAPEPEPPRQAGDASTAHATAPEPAIAGGPSPPAAGG